LWFTKNFQSSINTILDPSNFQVNYQIERAPDAALRDKANNLLPAQTDSLSFSSNGKWVVVDSPYRAMLRVNLDTFEVTPFAPAFNYDIGVAPGAQTAISNDGRYVVVASNSFQIFKIYDLNTCGSVPNTINAPVTCQSKDLQPFMRSQITNFQGVSNLRFLDDNLLSLYASRYLTAGDTSTNHVAKYVISSSGSSTQRIQYLAMGDSYISGEGAYSYVDGTDTDLNHCHLSQKSYPYLISSQLNFDSFHSVACSGATTNDIVNGGDSYRGQAQEKIEWGERSASEKNGSIENFNVGVANQLRFVQQYRPGVVTISISGNDIGFSNILKTCVVASYTCYNNYEDRLELIHQINNKFPTIVQTYQKIKDASPDAKIYAIGYPQVAFVGGDCAANVHLSVDEISFAQQLIAYLDQVIQLASAKAGIAYVDTQNALLGHRLCETKSSKVAVNGLTAGNDKPSILHGPMASESYHPNQLGHQLIDQAIMSATQNFTLAMPNTNNSVTLPSETTLAFLDIPKANRGIYNLSYDDSITNDIGYRGSLQNIYVDGLDNALKPQTAYSVTLHSDPINLGSFNTDINGNLSTDILIPADVPTGFHSLQITGVNMAGEPIEIYKTIYIGASPDDLDGDGSTDSINLCSFIGAANSDYDKDGIDDSCDGFIDEPPTISEADTESSDNDQDSGTQAQETVEEPGSTIPIHDSNISYDDIYNPVFVLGDSLQNSADYVATTQQSSNSKRQALALGSTTPYSNIEADLQIPKALDLGKYTSVDSKSTPSKNTSSSSISGIFILFGTLFLATISTAWIFVS
jgi:hypothetical protein